MRKSLQVLFTTLGNRLPELQQRVNKTCADLAQKYRK